MTTHGTNNTYTNYGCRCSECRAAATEYRRQRRSQNSVRGEAKHGTYNAYVNYGCRCEACTEANRIYHRAARERRKAAFLGQGQVDGFTDEE